VSPPHSQSALKTKIQTTPEEQARAGVYGLIGTLFAVARLGLVNPQ